MRLALNDLGFEPGDVYTDHRGRYRRVVLATDRFILHVAGERWVEER